MVRFIMQDIYQKNLNELNLHSNMVRFIIKSELPEHYIENRFTFQYG